MCSRVVRGSNALFARQNAAQGHRNDSPLGIGVSPVYIICYSSNVKFDKSPLWQEFARLFSHVVSFRVLPLSVSTYTYIYVQWGIHAKSPRPSVKAKNFLSLAAVVKGNVRRTSSFSR